MERLISLKNSINPKEYSTILNILKEYSITPDDVERKRSVYKVTQGDKIYCLKRTENGDKKAKKGIMLVSHLKNRGFNNIVEYIKTKDGKEYVRGRKSLYYLMEWIEGRECNVEDLDEMKAASRLLARFHMASVGFSPQGVRIESNFKNWPILLQSCKNDLNTYKSIIEGKKVQTSFDLEYYNFIDEFRSNMDTAISLLKKSSYIEISRRSKEIHSVCHDSFYYQNILKSEAGDLYLIDLDSTLYDIHVYDLAKFIRRILYKKVYSWSFDAARELIDSYTSINNISTEEYEVLLAFIIFPQKFWKLGRKRYIKKKRWNEDKYRKRLKRIIKFADKQKKFIEDFLTYYQLSV